MNRLGLKITCLVVSIVIWVQVASTSVVEQTIQLPLRLLGLSNSLTYEGSELPKSINVRVRGSKLALMNHNYFNGYIGEVQVNLGGYGVGAPFYYEVASTEVISDLEVVSIRPSEKIRLHIDEQVSRMLPVQLVTSGSLPERISFLVEPVVSVDSVLVSGPKRSFPDNPSLRTEPVELGQIKTSQTISVPLVSLDDLLIIEKEEVGVQFDVARLEDRTLANVPVVPLVDHGTAEVAISPPVVDVMVRGVADSIQALTESRFLVTVSVGTREEGIYALAGEVDPPSWLTVIGLDPPLLQVIVGNPVFADSVQVEKEVEDSVDGTE